MFQPSVSSAGAPSCMPKSHILYSRLVVVVVHVLHRSDWKSGRSLRMSFQTPFQKKITVGSVSGVYTSLLRCFLSITIKEQCCHGYLNIYFLLLCNGLSYLFVSFTFLSLKLLSK